MTSSTVEEGSVLFDSMSYRVSAVFMHAFFAQKIQEPILSTKNCCPRSRCLQSLLCGHHIVGLYRRRVIAMTLTMIPSHPTKALLRLRTPRTVWQHSIAHHSLGRWFSQITNKRGFLSNQRKGISGSLFARWFARHSIRWILRWRSYRHPYPSSQLLSTSAKEIEQLWWYPQP